VHTEEFVACAWPFFSSDVTVVAVRIWTPEARARRTIRRRNSDRQQAVKVTKTESGVMK